LEMNGVDSLLDGSVGQPHWFYAIGTFRLWQNALPGYAKTDSDAMYPQQVVELYTVNPVFVATDEPSLVTTESTATTLERTSEPTPVTSEPTLLSTEPTKLPTVTARTEEPTGATLEPTTLVTSEPTVVTSEPTVLSAEPTAVQTEEPTGATSEPTILVTSSEPTATEPTSLPSYINIVVISDFENDWNGVVDVAEDTHDDFYTKHGNAGYMLLGSAVLVLCAMCCCSRWLCFSKSKIVQTDTKVQVIIDAKTLERGIEGTNAMTPLARAAKTLERGLEGTKAKTPLARAATKSPALTDASSITDYDSITLQLYATQPEGIETMKAVE